VLFRSASPFVYDFIGRSNQIAGEVRDGLFFAPGMSAPLAGDGCGPGAAILYLRPHDLTLSESKRGLQAKVQGRTGKAPGGEGGERGGG